MIAPDFSPSSGTWGISSIPPLIDSPGNLLCISCRKLFRECTARIREVVHCRYLLVGPFLLKGRQSQMHIDHIVLNLFLFIHWCVTTLGCFFALYTVPWDSPPFFDHHLGKHLLLFPGIQQSQIPQNVEIGTPPKSNIDTKNDVSFSKCISFQTWHHFGYPWLGFRGCIYVPGSKLPLFPYNRGWSSTQ